MFCEIDVPGMFGVPGILGVPFFGVPSASRFITGLLTFVDFFDLAGFFTTSDFMIFSLFLLGGGKYAGSGPRWMIVCGLFPETC